MDTSDSALRKSQSVARIDLHEAIRRRAEEIYIRSGKVAGRDVQNWTQAEAEIMNELAERSGRRTAIVVNVDGVQYIGEYTDERANGYSPGEISQGAKVPVRFAGDKMFVTRPNGRELETTIVSKA
jgi:hypothetical protein